MRELWLARNTIIELLNDRKYTATQPLLNYAEFISKYPSVQLNCSILNFVATKENSQLGVHFTNDDKLPKASLEKIVQDFFQQSVSTFILVTSSKLNPSCKAYLKASKMVVDHFVIAELQFNVTKHTLVPPHRILSEEEGSVLLKSLRTDKGGLPTILQSDVVNRYIGGKIGDIIEITRSSLTTGTALYYRTVRES